MWLRARFQLWHEARGQALNDNTPGARQSIGGMAFLVGSRMLCTMRCASTARVLQVPRDAMLRLMAAEPEMSDIIVPVFAARRRATRERTSTAITVVGPA